jgi:hypothetical protein
MVHLEVIWQLSIAPIELRSIICKWMLKDLGPGRSSNLKGSIRRNGIHNNYALCKGFQASQASSNVNFFVLD